MYLSDDAFTDLNDFKLFIFKTLLHSDLPKLHSPSEFMSTFKGKNGASL